MRKSDVLLQRILYPPRLEVVWEALANVATLALGTKTSKRSKGCPIHRDSHQVCRFQSDLHSSTFYIESYYRSIIKVTIKYRQRSLENNENKTDTTLSNSLTLIPQRFWSFWGRWLCFNQVARVVATAPVQTHDTRHKENCPPEHRAVKCRRQLPWSFLEYPAAMQSLWWPRPACVLQLCSNDV